MNLLKRALMFALTRTQRGEEYFLICRLRSYLRQSGWVQSARSGLPQNAAGESLPWLTYPAIRFLTERIRPRFRVFEYGSGQSTLWWSTRVAKVVACEHDISWYRYFSTQLPSNAQILYQELDYGGNYCRVAGNQPARFDLIVIDGRDQVNCARESVGALTLDGVLVWDNTEREKYRAGFSHLHSQGFRQIDFWGLGPCGYKEWCTTVFYRSDNCLGL
jgi:hypothetical protein